MIHLSFVLSMVETYNLHFLQGRGQGVLTVECHLLVHVLG